MAGNARFWRNLGLIGLAHAAMVTGLVRWSSETKKPDAANIVWMGGTAGDISGATAKPTPRPKPAKISTPPPEVSSPDEQPDQPILTAAKSEIQMPTATPRPTPSSTPVSTTTPVPKPTPRVKVPPKSTPKPKPSPKPTPKPSPKKTVLAKLTPKATPKPKASPEKNEVDDDVDLENKKPAREEAEKKPDGVSADKPAGNASPKANRSTGASSAGSGRGGGATIQSQFGWYGSMLHDRFYSEWAQPTTAANSKASALVKIRIEKDGRISSFRNR